MPPLCYSGPMTNLVINLERTECSDCSDSSIVSTFRVHDENLNGTMGCGHTFTGITTNYLITKEAARKLARLRPDLPPVGLLAFILSREYDIMFGANHEFITEG